MPGKMGGFSFPSFIVPRGSLEHQAGRFFRFVFDLKEID